jgi:hypothetical protein
MEKLKYHMLCFVKSNENALKYADLRKQNYKFNGNEIIYIWPCGFKE